MFRNPGTTRVLRNYKTDCQLFRNDASGQMKSKLGFGPFRKIMPSLQLVCCLVALVALRPGAASRMSLNSRGTAPLFDSKPS